MTLVLILCKLVCLVRALARSAYMRAEVRISAVSHYTALTWPVELDESWESELVGCGCSAEVLANFKKERFFTKASAIGMSDELLKELARHAAVFRSLRKLLGRTAPVACATLTPSRSRV